MRRDPAFTATGLLALGSAIGVNTSLFTIFNAVALKSWTVREPDRVVTVSLFDRNGGRDFGIAEYRYLVTHTETLSGLIAMRNGERVKLDDRSFQLTYVSGNYFRVLGIDFERGRGFLNEEDRAGDPQAVVVISHDVWQNIFGTDPLIVGRTIHLDELPFTVVGVPLPILPARTLCVMTFGRPCLHGRYCDRVTRTSDQGSLIPRLVARR